MSTEPGEASLNPQGLWRRSQESWHHGAGQEFLDGKSEEAADPHRFRSSKGVDIWTRGQLSLLHPTLKVWDTASTNLHLAVAQMTGTDFDLFVADGTAIYSNVLPYSQVNSLALQTGTGWTATNGTIAVAPSPFHAWFQVTSTSAAIPSVTSPAGIAGMPVNPGRSYAIRFSSTAVTGTGRLPTVAVTWYTGAGVVISTTAPAVGTIDTTLGGITTTATAPATAAYASVTLSWTVAWASGDVHRVRQISFGPADLVQSYPFGWSIWDIQGGQPAQTIQSMVSNGKHVWGALGTSGLHRISASAVVVDQPAAPGAGQIHLVGWANGFLLAAGSATSTTGKNTLWRIDNPLGVPTLVVIKTHPDPSFEWTGISPGRSCVYAFGNSGGNGEVYKVVLDAAAGTLATAASFATYLPDGEQIHALTFYAGGIIMGTGKGLRLGQADAAGNIDYGPLVETEWPVKCLEPQGRWCWFGWTKYDNSNSGLGRVDLGYFTDTLTPAWASDLMSSDVSTGDTVSVVTLAPFGYTSAQRPPVRVFTVAGDGVYIEDPGSRTVTGTIDFGTIRFSTSEPKLVRTFDIRHHAQPADGVAVYAYVQRDTNGTWDLLTGSGYINPGGYGPLTALDAGSVKVEAMEFRVLFGRPQNPGTDWSRSLEITRWTAKVLPQPSTIDEVFTIPLVLRRKVEDLNGAGYPVDVGAEVTYLKGLERDRTLVTLQLGEESHTCYIVASEFQGQNWGEDRGGLEGIYTLQAMTIRG